MTPPFAAHPPSNALSPLTAHQNCSLLAACWQLIVACCRVAVIPCCLSLVARRLLSLLSHAVAAVGCRPLSPSLSSLLSPLLLLSATCRPPPTANYMSPVAWYRHHLRRLPPTARHHRLPAVAHHRRPGATAAAPRLRCHHIATALPPQPQQLLVLLLLVPGCRDTTPNATFAANRCRCRSLPSPRCRRSCSHCCTCCCRNHSQPTQTAARRCRPPPSPLISRCCRPPLPPPSSRRHRHRCLWPLPLLTAAAAHYCRCRHCAVAHRQCITAHDSLPAARCQGILAHCLLFSARCLLLAASRPPAACCPLPTAITCHHCPPTLTVYCHCLLSAVAIVVHHFLLLPDAG